MEYYIFLFRDNNLTEANWDVILDGQSNDKIISATETFLN